MQDSEVGHRGIGGDSRGLRMSGSAAITLGFCVGGFAYFSHPRGVAICNARYAKEWMAWCCAHRGSGARARQVLRHRSVRLSRVLKLDLTALNELKSLLAGRMRSVDRMRR
jgi:hypothetical protein